MADTESKRRNESQTRDRRQKPQGRNWWTTEPRLGRVAHGVANRVDRLKAIGNGQVPEVAKTAWEVLNK